MKRAFYEQETIKGCWTVKELDRQVSSLYYERIGTSKDKMALQQQVADQTIPLTPKDVIHDPVSLEFLELQKQDVFTETKLETAIIDHLQHFLLEMGRGFCFEARQKRILIDQDYFKADLIFYHRILKCHVIVDLKTDRFRHEKWNEYELEDRNDMVLKNLQNIQNEYRDAIVQQWKEITQQKYPDFHPNEYYPCAYTCVGIDIDQSRALSVHIGLDSNQLYCELRVWNKGTGQDENYFSKDTSLSSEFQSLLPKKNGRGIWQYFPKNKFKEAYSRFEEVITSCVNMINTFAVITPSE